MASTGGQSLKTIVADLLAVGPRSRSHGRLPLRADSYRHRNQPDNRNGSTLSIDDLLAFVTPVGNQSFANLLD